MQTIHKKESRCSHWTHLILANKTIGLDGLLPLQEDHVIQRGKGEWLWCYASGNYEKLREQTFVGEMEELIPHWAVNLTEVNVTVDENNPPGETLREQQAHAII